MLPSFSSAKDLKSGGHRLKVTGTLSTLTLVHIWNKLPEEAIAAYTITTFKRHSYICIWIGKVQSNMGQMREN